MMDIPTELLANIFLFLLWVFDGIERSVLNAGGVSQSWRTTIVSMAKSELAKRVVNDNTMRSLHLNQLLRWWMRPQLPTVSAGHLEGAIIINGKWKYYGERESRLAGADELREVKWDNKPVTVVCPRSTKNASLENESVT